MKKLLPVLITPFIFASHHKANIGVSLQAESLVQDNTTDIHGSIGLYLRKTTPWVLGEYPLMISDSYQLQLGSNGAKLINSVAIGNELRTFNIYGTIGTKVDEGDLLDHSNKYLQQGFGIGYEQLMDTYEGMRIGARAGVETDFNLGKPQDSLSLAIYTSIDFLNEE